MNDQISAIQRILGKNKTKNHTGRRNPKTVQRHIWTVEEENLAFDLYKANSTEEDIILAISETELKLSSMKMKISNIRYLHTGEGLKNVSGDTVAIFNSRKHELIG